MFRSQVVEDGYEFFAKRQLVTVFSAPNYCGEFDNAGAMMSVDDSLMCSFQILKPAEKKQKYVYGATAATGRPATPPRGGPQRVRSLGSLAVLESPGEGQGAVQLGLSKLGFCDMLVMCGP